MQPAVQRVSCLMGELVELAGLLGAGRMVVVLDPGPASTPSTQHALGQGGVDVPGKGNAVVSSSSAHVALTAGRYPSESLIAPGLADLQGIPLHGVGLIQPC